MSKPKTPDIPEAPKYFTDPNFEKGVKDLMGLGGRLTSFDFTGNLSPLAATIDTDPEVTKLALQYAQNAFTPAFNDTVTQLRNEAAASGALQSSTFTDALAKAGQNLNSQFQATVSQAALEDRSRALQNRVNLFGTGINAISGATGLSGQNQQNVNQFNLSNYENQVAKALADFESQNRLSPFEQVLSINPFVNDYFTSQGRTGVPFYGTADYLDLASTFSGGIPSGGGFGSKYQAAPRSSASNNPFAITNGYRGSDNSFLTPYI